MNPRSLTAVLCLCTVIWLSVGCSSQTNIPSVEPRSTSTLPAGKGGELQPEARPTSGALQDHTPPSEQVVYPFQGKVSFDSTDGKSASIMIDSAAAGDQVITLTTSNGIRWELSIPPGAVEENVEIKITELKDIVSEDLGSLFTGVLLEPDNLRFRRPVMLRMQGEGLGDHAIIFGGNHDGTHLDFAITKKDMGGVSAYLWHFSTVYGDPLTDEEKRAMVEAAAEGGYASVMKRALQVLDANPPKIPAPPPIPLRCIATKGDRYQKDLELLNNFYEEFREPEYSLISALVSIGLQDQEWDSDADDQQLTDIVQRLLERSMTKVDLLWQSYYPQEEYFLPVSIAANNTEQDVSNLEFILFGRTEPRLVYFKHRQEWASLLAEKFFTALRDEHDYEIIDALLLTDKLAMLDPTSQYKNILSKIIKALNFKIQYDVQASTNVEYDTVTWETQGIAVYNLLNDRNGVTGKGKYTAFEWPVPEGLGVVEMTSPKDFDYDVVIEQFDACETKTIELTIHRFSADAETYVIDGMDMGLASGNGFVAAIMLATFDAELVEAPAGREGSEWYRFTIPVQNRKATAGEMEIPRQVPNNTANLKIQVIHTPE